MWSHGPVLSLGMNFHPSEYISPSESASLDIAVSALDGLMCDIHMRCLLLDTHPDTMSAPGDVSSATGTG